MLLSFAASAGHVFNDDGRLTGNMLAEGARDRVRVGVEAAAGGSGDDHADGFALVKIFLGARADYADEDDSEQNKIHTNDSFLHQAVALRLSRAGRI
jgi:hypothetical protein